MNIPRNGRRTRRSLTVALGVALCCTLVLSACGSGGGTSNGTAAESAKWSPASSTWKQTLKEARKEGSVTLYLSQSNYGDHLAAAWHKDYPDIKINVVDMPAGPLSTKLDTELAHGSTNGADVADTSSRQWFLQNIDHLEKLYGPAAKLYSNNPNVTKRKIYTPQLVPFVFANNVKVLKSVKAHPVRNWEDLLQPQLKGLIAMPDPKLTPVWAQVWWVLYQQRGLGFIKKLAEMQPRFPGNYQAIGAGDVAVDWSGTPVSFAQEISKGAPVKVFPMEDPEFVISYAAGIVKSAPHPAAAQVLLNWMVSRQGQEGQHSWGKSGSLLPGVKGALKFKTDKYYTGNLTADQKKFINTVWNPLFGR